MTLTDYQAKYIAAQLTQRFPPDSAEKNAATLVDAQVDLNPYEIDAAWVAIRSQLSQEAPLADEVGLGKTIEADLVHSPKGRLPLLSLSAGIAPPIDGDDKEAK